MTDTTFLKRLSIVVIITDLTQTRAAFRGVFEQFYFAGINTLDKYHTNATSYFFDDAVFCGLRNIHNKHPSININIQHINSTTLYVTSQTLVFDYIQVEVINFVIFPCLIDQYYHKSQQICYDICPNTTYTDYDTSECFFCDSLVCLMC